MDVGSAPPTSLRAIVTLDVVPALVGDEVVQHHDPSTPSRGSGSKVCFSHGLKVTGASKEQSKDQRKEQKDLLITPCKGPFDQSKDKWGLIKRSSWGDHWQKPPKIWLSPPTEKKDVRAERKIDPPPNVKRWLKAKRNFKEPQL